MATIEPYRDHFPFALLALPFKLCGVSKHPLRRKTAAQLLEDAQAYLNKTRPTVRRADGPLH
jgi:hypothetical protein